MSDINKSEELVFMCPSCGGRTYGTSGDTGYCHDDQFGCKFRWPRANDWKYFRYVRTSIQTFSSEEEYEDFLEEGSL